MSDLNKQQHVVTVIQANGQSEFESIPIETIEGDSQLWQMLGLSAAQLTYFLEDEILENPFIELDYPKTKPQQASVTLQEHSAIIGVDPQMPEAPRNLPMFLFEQIMMYRHTIIRDAMVRLIDLLNPQGYLPYSYQEVAKQLGIEPIIALDAITLFQQLEPAGIGAYDLRECLMLQTEQDAHAPNVAYYLLEEYFDQLKAEDYQAIVTATGLPLADVLACVSYYQTLRTSPADLFQVEEEEGLLDDVTVLQDQEGMKVRYNAHYYPKLIFNEPYYQEMLATQDPEVVAFSKPQKLMYDRLARNLRMREQLILKVAQAIAAVQHDYFSQLSDSKVPLLLKQVAEITGLPEPVVNLLVSNKNMGFGQYVLPMTDFITVATREDRDGFSAEKIKQIIHEILHDAPADLSDEELVERLEERKIMISPFMVRNYRQALGH
ncbi:RNA polymerase subunit sigma-54 [Abiotrophia sp.]|uniref:RNA polymerase factor sigma-54 n=1 Tax=Abiotrophia sp. TaxID=76631 RepID=UPI0027B9096A|nr:RNA polymerase subunit sigma-54 [Abiotrophia sp.]